MYQALAHNIDCTLLIEIKHRFPGTHSTDYGDTIICDTQQLKHMIMKAYVDILLQCGSISIANALGYCCLALSPRIMLQANRH